MHKQLSEILGALLQPNPDGDRLTLADPSGAVRELGKQEADIASRLNAAFLICLCGAGYPRHAEAEEVLAQFDGNPAWSEVVAFYREGLKRIGPELDGLLASDPEFGQRWDELRAWVNDAALLEQVDAGIEKLWSVFFPEGQSIRSNPGEAVRRLREQRKVTTTSVNSRPIRHPVQEILFTSNVLLGIPARTTDINDLPLSEDVRARLRDVCREDQAYWYDHPIQIGVKPEQNEVLYGLSGLDQAVEFERQRGNLDAGKLTCVLSVSVTHEGLRDIAKSYVAQELQHAGGLKNLEVYVFTESDTRRLLEEVLVPAVRRYRDGADTEALQQVFGVNGAYGRHYSFLKAIAALWNDCVDERIRATFKIDLDQVFPQEQLVDEAGASAFELFRIPLWGGRGLDADGVPVDLGMIAGALVNERDIGSSLFTPDVTFPGARPRFDECIFFSRLPQAVGTEAEMMARYDTDDPRDAGKCIQRIHVTGGTNGILVDSLKRHRPFTPTFIGRAEDQAYILSVFQTNGSRLAYVHCPGLIMRHDKEAFASEAIKAAKIGSLIGDYVRILLFSAYAREIADDVDRLKKLIDPFTGCFVSKLPVTLVYLRFALKASALFADGQDRQGLEFVTTGAPRLLQTLEFTRGSESKLARSVWKERAGWNLYYDTLAALKTAAEENEPFAVELREKAASLIADCKIDVKGGT